MKRMAVLLIGLLLAGQRGLAGAAELPGDDMPFNSRTCFLMAPMQGSAVKRLLLELHKEQVNPGDEPAIWARVYGEKQGEARPGYNYDGCSAHEPGETGKTLDYLRCGFSCDAGTLSIRTAEGGLAISPENLFLRSCGVGEELMGGFQIKAEDVGATALVTPIDDAECRKVMAPLEKIMDDAEAAIQ